MVGGGRNYLVVERLNLDQVCGQRVRVQQRKLGVAVHRLGMVLCSMRERILRFKQLCLRMGWWRLAGESVGGLERVHVLERLPNLSLSPAGSSHQSPTWSSESAKATSEGTGPESCKHERIRDPRWTRSNLTTPGIRGAQGTWLMLVSAMFWRPVPTRTDFINGHL